MSSTRRTDRPTSRLQRGATVVEYSLLVAILAVGSIGAISFMQSAAKAKTESSAEHISTRTIPESDQDGGSGGDEGGGGATTTTTTTSTPPTSTPPTSTSTTTSTTTTTTTTTTIPTATTASADWAGTATDTRRRNGDNEWRASATISVTDDLGNPVSGATVTVSIRYRRSGNSWTTASGASATTRTDGTRTFDSSWYRTSGSNRVDDIRFRVTSVDPPGLDYDGGQPSVTVSR